MELPDEVESLLKPAEVAALFNVDPKTVSSWGDLGKLSVIRTLGGHRRYLASEVLALRNSHIRAIQPSMPAQRDR